jgi:TonB family protein
MHEGTIPVSPRHATIFVITLGFALNFAGMPAHADTAPGLAKWIATATQTDTVWVHRLGMRLVPLPDSVAAGRRWWSPYMLSSGPAKTGWSERFTALLSDSLTYSPDRRCSPKDTTARPADDLVVGIDFGSCDSCAIAVCYFHEGCVRLSTRHGPAGALGIDRSGKRRALLALLAEALPHDDVLRLAAANSNDPEPGDYIFVEELPEALRKVPPVYPEAARRQGVEGTVMVQALVGTDGLVKRTAIKDSIPPLDEAAMQAVRQWVFRPARTGGAPIAVWVMVPVRFRLR